MSQTAQKQTLGFQAEVKQLLHLMIHSLYSNKEIFLRELISNAADASDKLRFLALSDPTLTGSDSELHVKITFDKEKRTVTVSDNGVGLNREEAIAHLGTIAKSGTQEFLAALTGDAAKDTKLIGQFGVGFYSSFIVANKVTVLSRRAGLASDQAICWESSGEGDYSIEFANKETRGTDVILHLREGEDEFLEDRRLRHIIQKYSDHISIPVKMKNAQGEFEAVNRATALWTLPKSEIKEEEYQEFYKYIAHDFENPLLWIHNRVEGKQTYTNLLYIPAQAPFDLYGTERHRGLKLYVRRVFIMDEAEQFLPMYLRFVRGVVDSDDLPLNISREILQNNKLVSNMRSQISKRILDALEKLTTDNKEKYQQFWMAFGNVMKEGPAEDFTNREQIARLLRFATTQTNAEAQTVSLDDYVDRMKSGQEKIYYVTAESFAAAKNSPHLEIFKEKGIEVLLLSDRIDEWLVTHLTEYRGKQWQSVAKGAIDLSQFESEEVKEEHKKTEAELASFTERAQKILGEKVKEVKISHRLTESPACLVMDEADLSSQMQRLLKATGRAFPTSKPILELNPHHRFVEALKDEQDEARFSEWVHFLFEQAQLAEGGHLEDPGQFVRRMNALLSGMM